MELETALPKSKNDATCTARPPAASGPPRAKPREDRCRASRPHEIMEVLDQPPAGQKLRVLTAVDTFSRFCPRPAACLRDQRQRRGVAGSTGTTHPSRLRRNAALPMPAHCAVPSHAYRRDAGRIPETPRKNAPLIITPARNPWPPTRQWPTSPVFRRHLPATLRSDPATGWQLASAPANPRPPPK